ncbi:hypothetical protein GDO86_012458 [Hymenochirus boettgeri]|uniref:PH domain-containing protein n=1 Tax=Hymenochirus boettgeri TaxID=247094 RepID=A0A8T2ISM3_9PIPI|nr:hypothetical protein GDO86_012458 [Hymenochirus boettgeri]
MTEEMERPRSGLSVASSVATTASVSVGHGSRPSTRSVKRVHTFGKREYSIKRDPNSTVVIRGWLYKQDSSGLRLWKRRWFVLSDFCLFYYRDSREENVLGSILLPSYEILPANPREVKNRKFSFKAEHPGMRTYYFGADTQEDMNAWIRAMNQSALVVAEEKNKNSQVHNLTNSTQEDLYASYEDFSHSGISPDGERAKSAESLEIAHLSESRSQDEISRDSLPEQERNGDLDNDHLFSGLKESLSDVIQQFTTTSQNGSVPPPTPENGIKNTEFSYRQELEKQRSLERKDSIPEDEEWVPFHKDEPGLKESLESFCARSPTRHRQKGFECPHDAYSSPLSRSAPSSPSVLSAHIFSSEGPERNSRDGKYLTQTVTPESPEIRNRYQSSISSCSPSRLTCPSPEIRDYVVQRLVKPSRSLSLPPTPSELPRHRMAKMSPPPNVKYGSPLICEKASPTRKEMSLTSSRSPKGQPNQSQGIAREDMGMSASPSLGRLTIRSNTPISRVDMHPAEDKIGNSLQVPRHSEERVGEYYVTSSRTRNQIMKTSSRPQTPADRYDVMPTEDHYSSSTMAKGPNRYCRRSQPLGAEDERLIDCGVTIPQRTHAYPNSRMQMRPNTPSERVIVEEYPSELSLTPSLRRHQSQPTRYSERALLPPAVFTGRVGTCAPRQSQKLGSSSYSQLPPLPPVAGRPVGHIPAGKRMSLSAVPSGSTAYRERVPYPARLAENNIDVLLTKLCGQDKLLVSVEDETAHLRTEKEKLEGALQATHHHLEEFQGQEHVIENIWYQQRLLQDDLVYVRARLCDLSLERERAWEEYRVLENELHSLRETLDRVSQIGHPQDQLAAQRDLWMINDIISGLRFNKSSFHVIPESSRHPGMMMSSPQVSEPQPAYPKSFLHHSGQREAHKDLEAAPPRPPLPREHHSSTDIDGKSRVDITDQNEPHQPTNQNTDSSPIHIIGPQPSSTAGEAVPNKEIVESQAPQTSCPVSIPTSHKGALETKGSSPTMAEVGTVRKQRMSAEEQMERMRRHQEAQIHERPKPGVSTQRQNSLRGATPVIGGRLRSVSSDSVSSGLNSQQVDSPSVDQRKPALVKLQPRHHQDTFSYDLKLDTDQQEVKKRPVERFKTVTKPSPATSPGSFSRHSDEGYSTSMEGQRDRIMSLSYTLATEASELSKIMTAKTLVDDDDANSDISTSDEVYPWDFIMQDSRSSKQSEKREHAEFKATPNTMQGEENAAKPSEHCQTLHVTNNISSGEPSSPRLQHNEEAPKGLCSSKHLDNLHYENWTAQGEKENTDHCPKTSQESAMLSKCNGQVSDYEFLIQDLHYNPLNMGKVAEYCKEEREPIRITLLQSSF